MDKIKLQADYIFETSWEVCNKVGGIHTVISTKAQTLVKKYKDNLIFIGPDIWKDSKQNNEFTEDKKLFRGWKIKAYNNGIRVKIGRWNIPGKPIAILVDFTPFIAEKDAIFSKLWELYHLDSISGQWDYVESALFGYAAGKVVESFTNYNISPKEKIIAHFHEWQTGTGILYLKKNAPYIATVFTTHATTIGRSIAGNNQALYKYFFDYNSDAKAQELNVVSKHSLEKTAAQISDSFTTVSENTRIECKQFLNKDVDIVTPNGFEDNFISDEKDFQHQQQEGRNKLIEVAQALLGYKLPDNILLTGISGRYEFRNKGIDIFLKSLKELNNNEALNKEILAYILIPADQLFARKDLINKLSNPGKNAEPLPQPFITHTLNNSDNDLILREIKNLGLLNNKSDKVKVIFVPSYLNGHDNIFNLSYYKLLMGFDISVFPSYYEPWGYTPLESIAFKVPTITTSLSGFGKWVKKFDNKNNGVYVVERNDDNSEKVIDDIVNTIISFSEKSIEEINNIKISCFNFSKNALWKNFIKYYYQAFDVALKKAEERKDSYIEKIPQTESKIHYEPIIGNKPNWRKLFINAQLPDKFDGLNDLAKNIWSSWNYKATDLFEYINPEMWIDLKKNPLLLLKNISQQRLTELENDKLFIEKYNAVYNEFKDYINVKPKKDEPNIAYFSMEYGLNNNLKIYSGGLGLLAGDYLKEASDSQVNIVGIGLMYKYGYFTQRLSLGGEQLSELEPLKFSQLPITPVRDNTGTCILININLPGRSLTARVWRIDVGRIPLFLLDTDIEENNEDDRKITSQLYGGNLENRLKQEILLGIGGIRLLNKLNINPDIYHCNEGHAAFINVERLAQFTNVDNFSFEESLEIVRSSSLFTTHTPVPAGHDVFSEDLIRMYLRHIPKRLKISWEQFLGLGKIDCYDPNEKFSMSILAAKTSQEINGVSLLHGKVTREMFKDLYKGYTPEESYIGYVTNGVHYPTWTAKEWRILYEKNFGEGFLQDISNKKYWEKIYGIDDEIIWNIKQGLKKKLIDYIKIRFKRHWIKRYENPKKLVDILNKINENTLTLGFARRFATYKRAHLLFTDVKRLERIVNNKEMPVQIIFAGKAHPKDKAGQDLIKLIVEMSKKSEFEGKIIFLENYDIELAKRLVKGVDVWLNTPTRPLEASGTSGQKAELNGTLNFSVLDGWWLEGYKENAGWALTQVRTYENQNYQDQLDAQTIYAILENQIIPTFYDRNSKNISTKWVQIIKKSIAEIAPDFTTKRMIDDYKSKYYNKLFIGHNDIKKNNYEKAIKIAKWKKYISRYWDDIEVISVDFPSTSKRPFNYGQSYHGEVILDLKNLINDDICVEMVIKNDNEKIITKELKKDNKVDTIAVYKIDLKLTQPGIFDYGLRIYAKNQDIPHRQDFNYIKWL